MTAAVRRGQIGAVAESVTAGRAFCRELSSVTDDWVVELFEEALAAHRPSGPVALMATGGYGRGELAPQSDLDLLLVHDVKPRKVAKEIEPLASALWYPLWDAGVKLGHAVRRIDEQLELAGTDLDSATALLTARPLAGDDTLAAELVDKSLELWRQHADRHLAALRSRVRVRQETAGDVAYLLEPDLKDGHGGLRDVQSLWWARSAGLQLIPEDVIDLERAYDVLMRARVALHLATERAGDVLRLEDQDATATAGGWADADRLMADVAAAGRSIAWLCDENWDRAVPPKKPRPPQPVAPGVIIVDGEVGLTEDADPAADATLVLQTAVAAARHERRIGRGALTRLADGVAGWPGTWPVGARDDLVALLLEGHRAIPVLESLDQRDLFARLLPEWSPVRSKPQRNAYHRYTVDRHLWEAAANASELADRVGRPDLLVLGALLHDIGKGYPGDHTEVGMELIRVIGPKLGLVPRDVDVLVAMVEHHLLLPDVAVRRDLADPATIRSVANAVGTVEVLELLHALTEADSKATGPSAWGDWKEELVTELVGRVRHVLGGGDVAEVTWRLFPDAETLAIMAAGAHRHRPPRRRDHDRQPGRRRHVQPHRRRAVAARPRRVSAQAHSDEGGMAASRFRIVVPDTGLDWPSLEADLGRALHRQLAIEARLAARAQTYRRRRRMQAAMPGPPDVEFDDDASGNATVIDVRAVTNVGILHRISKALGELGLDIRHATVQTLGMEIVDTFYVRANGALVTDPAYRAEIRRAVLHAVS